MWHYTKKLKPLKQVMGVGRRLYPIIHKQPAFRGGVGGLFHFKTSLHCSGCPSGEATAPSALNFNRSYFLYQPQDSTVSHTSSILLVNTLYSVLQWWQLKSWSQYVILGFKLMSVLPPIQQTASRNNQTKGFYQTLGSSRDALPLLISHWNACLNDPRWLVF